MVEHTTVTVYARDTWPSGHPWAATMGFWSTLQAYPNPAQTQMTRAAARQIQRRF
ncbi:hypothetical protein [Intestinimonas butyriciproducens]|uniref:hypothetical protein n=1 Tax=Intestinimonas butyriciproducens TaxID=1297617 RepID=UPI00242C40D3|nr:hypothetical protein [Intestinimonas butyriciproducens]MCI6363047.1 hypothetical protein [Intestinimonas butyriciproducens]MDY3615040.1 hypothetical protein [Intestinimonas butyriciproducens]